MAYMSAHLLICYVIFSTKTIEEFLSSGVKFGDYIQPGLLLSNCYHYCSMESVNVSQMKYII